MSYSSTSDLNGSTDAYNAQSQRFQPSEETVKRGCRRRDTAVDVWHYGIGGASNKASQPKTFVTSSGASSETLYIPPTPRSGANILKARLSTHIAVQNVRATLFKAIQRKLATTVAGSVLEDEIPHSSNLSLSDRISEFKQRVLWRFDRILTYGLDDGLETRKPVYFKLKA